MSTTDSMALAAEAGLHYVQDDLPGFRRIRRGKGFSYEDPDRASVQGDARERIESLVIPPAWTDVWISPDDSGHIRATGYDKAGRKQYLYHPLWVEIRDEVKFERVGDFGRRVSRLRRRVDSDLRKPGLARRKVTALAVSVLDQTLIRVGSPRYAEENDVYGLTTLTCDHVEVDGLHVHLEFAGKGRADHQLAFKDRRLASLLARCQELAGQTLFSYHAEDGPTAVTSTDVNLYLADTMAGPFTAKDFRTWGGTTTVAGHLASASGDEESEDERLLSSIDYAAEKLGNTREVFRSSYLHPVIPEAFRDGRLQEAWSRSRRGVWVDRSESTVNRLLGEEAQ